jgi:hypothetical protein
MNVSEFSEKLGGRILTGESSCEKQINGVYCCDLLSWVMSHAAKGSAWITVHNHVNIVAWQHLPSCPASLYRKGSKLRKRR